MKALGVWLAGFVLLFGGYSGVTHLVRDSDPESVFVIVDSSFQMREVWTQVPDVLDEIDDARYAEYALATEKGPVHGWQEQLTLGAADAFAPCGFDRVETYPLVAEADQVVVVTTEGSCETDSLPSDWVVRRLEG